MSDDKDDRNGGVGRIKKIKKETFLCGHCKGGQGEKSERILLFNYDFK